MILENKTAIQNLVDAGVDEKTVKQFSELLENGTYCQQMKLLKEKRCVLLDDLHKCQNRLDYLDYLICAMKKDRPTECK